MAKAVKRGRFPKTERYEKHRRIGGGGMGVVYEAFDKELGRHIALKTLRKEPEGDNILQFKTEFRSLQGLRHPNLVKLYELHADEGQWFFTMELVEGVHFLDWVRPNDEPWSTPPSSQAQNVRSGSGWGLIAEPTGQNPSSAMVSSPGTAVANSGPRVALAGLRLDRLRDATVQLARGLRRLHTAGKVHRDVKPANTLVTNDGRLVLLDFGLIADMGADLKSGKSAGTPSYMAPEQAHNAELGPEADWYSMGVMVFEAITGKVPFDGPPLKMLLDRGKLDPEPPSSLVAGIPEDIDTLCLQLLQRDPEARPHGVFILRQLGDGADVAPVLAQPSSKVSTPFVGREHELQSLERALADVQKKGDPVICLLSGESGVGKSALVQEFADRNAEAARTFTARCRQNEALPFKAVDGIVDAISEFLTGFNRQETDALLPRDAALLTQAFPVLKRCPSFVSAPKVNTAQLHPGEVRKRMFDALAEFLQRLASKHRIVLSIDDLQWADADSLALLERVFAGSLPPPVLLVVTQRDHVGVADTAVSVLGASGCLRQSRVEPLPPADASALAESLLGEVESVAPEELVSESEGHPLYMELLAAFARSGASKNGVLRLEEAFGALVDALPLSSQKLLELVTTTNKPISHSVLAKAADIRVDESIDTVLALQAGKLVRATGLRKDDKVEPLDARVESAVWATSAADRSEAHRRLAVALSGEDIKDPEALFFHWHGAGDDQEALNYLLESAQTALDAFAFERAAELFRRGVDIDGRRPEFLVGLAAALASLGRSVEAAGLYQRAAALEESEERMADLHREEAASLLLKSGHIDAGLDALVPLLEKAGMPVPSSGRQAVARALARRAALKLSHPKLVLKAKAGVAPETLRALERCHQVSTGLGILKSNLAMYYCVRHLQLALKAGDPRHYSLAVIKEAIGSAAVGGKPQHSDQLLEKAEVQIEQLDDPYLRAILRLGRNHAAFLRGEYNVVASNVDGVDEDLQNLSTAVYWERSVASLQKAVAGVYASDFTHHEAFAEALTDARAINDLFKEVVLTAGPAMPLWLAVGEAAAARERLNYIEQTWNQASFDVTQFVWLCGAAQLDLYEGKSTDALARITDALPGIQKSLLLHVTFHKVHFLDLCIRVGLAVTDSGDDSGLRFAKKHLARLKKETSPWARCLAQLASLQMDPTSVTAAQLETLKGAFRECGMALHATLLGEPEAVPPGLVAPEQFRRFLIPRGDMLSHCVYGG